MKPLLKIANNHSLSICSTKKQSIISSQTCVLEGRYMSIPQKTDLIRLSLLHKYGIWVGSDTIVIRDLKPSGIKQISTNTSGFAPETGVSIANQATPVHQIG